MNKTYRKLPKRIKLKIGQLESDYVEAGCVLKVTEKDLKHGRLQTLGIMSTSQLDSDHSIIPNRKNGLISKKNVDGHVIVRKDLSKYQKAFFFEVPIWGDWSKGSTTITQYRDVYPREVIAPTSYSLNTSILSSEHCDDETFFLLKIKVGSDFYKYDIDFERALLSAINLLQENIGLSDIFEPNAPASEYMKEEYLDWEIFPAGEKDALIKSLLCGSKKTKSYMNDRVEDRFEALASLAPKAYIKGTNSFGSYFGAKIRENLIVFENVNYGNAIYILQEDWEELSKLSRTQLLKEFQGRFHRITHNNNWKSELKRKVLELVGDVG